MNTVINTKVSVNRGKPRIWIEGKKISPTFEPGDRFSLEQDVSNKRITLKPTPEGQYTVSVRNRNNRSWPLIELRGEDVSTVFEVEMSLRIIARKGKLTIEIHGRSKKSASRVSEFLSRLINKEAIEIGSIFTGAGILDRAIHQGLSDCGIKSYTKFIVEREGKYIESLLSNQSDLFRDNSTIVHSSIEDVEFTGAMNIDVLLGSLPCIGASRAGASKKGLKAAELDSDSGAAFYYWLNFVQKLSPLCVVMENVIEYAKSMGMAVITSVLNTLGYDVKLTKLNGNDFGTIENRDRMAMVAISKELNAISDFDIDSIIPFKEREGSIKELLEPIANDDKRWKSYSYLADKQVRDAIAGKGFKRQLVNGCEHTIGTLRRLYHKGGSCDQFIKHENYAENGLTRLFTPVEHARLKGICEGLVKGSSDTIKHEMLGQSICFPVFQALGRALGRWALKLN